MRKGRMPVMACGPFLLVLCLSGCGSSSSPSAEENRQLDNASQMLDQAPTLLANIDENALGPADEPADENSINTDE